MTSSMRWWLFELLLFMSRSKLKDGSRGLRQGEWCRRGREVMAVPLMLNIMCYAPDSFDEAAVFRQPHHRCGSRGRRRVSRRIGLRP